MLEELTVVDGGLTRHLFRDLVAAPVYTGGQGGRGKDLMDMSTTSPEYKL